MSLPIPSPQSNLTTVKRNIVAYLYHLSQGSGSPVNLTAPSIAVQGGGDAVPGSILEGTPGTWTGSPTLTYQWLRDGTAIPGETSIAGYTVVSADRGASITLLEIPNGNSLAGVPSNGIDVDDLAGLPFSVRWQAASTPLGLYQDEACTVPVDTEFQNIAGMKDENSGTTVIFSQSDPDKQAVAVIFDGHWAPFFDGLDDEYRTSYVMPDNDMTLVSVWNRTSEGSFPVLNGSYDGGTNNNRSLYIDSPGVDNLAWGNSPAALVPTYDFTHNVTWVGLGVMQTDYSVQLYSGGLLGSSTLAHSTSDQVCTMGLGVAGYLLATMVIERAATSDEIALITNFAIDQYGASIQEPL